MTHHISSIYPNRNAFTRAIQRELPQYRFTTNAVAAAYLVRPNGASMEGGTKARRAAGAKSYTISEFLIREARRPDLIGKLGVI